jgi:hypothetical protein
LSAENQLITPEMTLIEVLHQHRQTEAVFRRYEGEAQGCLLCHALFDTLEEAAAKYGLDLTRLLNDLQEVAAVSAGGPGRES